MTRPAWQLASGTFWADAVTLVGGDPFRSIRLTERGAAFVGQVIEGVRRQASEAEGALLHRLARGNLLIAPTTSVGTNVAGAAEAALADVTLVIPARADAASAQTVLNSAPGVPAVVVDDGSSPPLDGLLRHDGPLRVIRNEVSQGPAAARNRGARAADTRWIAFCDADIVAAPGWLGALLAQAGPDLAIAPRIVTADSPGVAGRFERAVCALDMGTRPGYIAPAGVLSYVPSATLLIRRERFLQLGGFDESMQVGEDVDLCWRAADEGIKYEPSVVLMHRPRSTLGSALARRAAYGASSAELARKHPQLMRHGSFPIAAALPWLLAMAGRPRLAAAASLAHIALAPRSMPTLPPSAAHRAAATGQGRSALALSRMTVRPLLPVTVGLAAVSKGFRLRAAAAAAVALLGRRPASAAGWRLLDDVAYAAGAWRGAVRHRRPGLLLPHLRLGTRRAKG